MANRKVNAAEQQIIVDNLNYLWSLNPCQAQANALANIYRAVFPKRSWEGNAWSLWVDLGAFAASAPPEDVEDIDTEEAEDAPADDDVSPAPSNGRRTRKRGK